MDGAYFEDPNGRKAYASLAVVATEEVLQIVENKTPSQKVRDAVQLIRTLPTATKKDLYYAEHRYLLQLAHAENSDTSGPAYVVAFCDRLENSLRASGGIINLSFAQAQKALWDEKMAEAVSIVARHHPVMKSRNTEFKKMLAQNVTLQAFSALDVFSESNAFAVFCCLKFDENIHQGYVVDKDGGLGPLSRALLFESLPAVEHAAKRWRNTFQGLPKVQVVNLKMHVDGLGPILPTIGASGYNANALDLDGSVIHEIGAQLQRKAIEQALEHASVEQIEQALERKSSQIKRKM